MPSIPSQPLGRRDALRMIGAGALAFRRVGVESPLRFGALDHLEYFISDIQRSLAFYTRVFGNQVWKNNRTARRYLKLGSTYIAFEQAADLRVDHFCAGIEEFQIAGLHSYLAERNIEYRDYPSGRDLYVSDPDGNRLQLGSNNSWVQLSASTASPEAFTASGDAIFRPVALDHILLNVSNSEKSAAFYEKILGAVTQRNNNRTWFQIGKSRIGLLQTPAGQRAGVNHFCVSAAPFDYDAATRALERAGAKVEAPELPQSPQFRDPDGYLIQVVPVS